jgi:16S rRNA (guanine966-N2)-methyltransferase
VREAVFDVLEHLARGAGAAEPGGSAAAVPGPLAGHRVLDLFAGSGALGIEALSRGAAHCTFVERDRPALHALRANLAAVGVEVLRRRAETASPPPSPGPTARIAAVDARRALVADARGGEMYTLVLVDPPYARYGELEGDLARLLAPLLAPGALVALETHRDQALRLPWRIERVKRYGDTQVAFMATDEE